MGVSEAVQTIAAKAREATRGMPPDDYIEVMEATAAALKFHSDARKKEYERAQVPQEADRYRSRPDHQRDVR